MYVLVIKGKKQTIKV